MTYSSNMNAFMERGMGFRLTKKFVFNHEGRDDVLQKICDQIDEKNTQEVKDKVEKIIW